MNVNEKFTIKNKGAYGVIELELSSNHEGKDCISICVEENRTQTEAHFNSNEIGIIIERLKTLKMRLDDAGQKSSND